MNGQQAHSSYAFGQFSVDPQRRVVFAHGRALSLSAKCVDALLYLIVRAGDLVPKQELMHALWPDAFVEDNNLNPGTPGQRCAVFRVEFPGESCGGRYRVSNDGGVRTQ